MKQIGNMLLWHFWLGFLCWFASFFWLSFFPFPSPPSPLYLSPLVSSLFSPVACFRVILVHIQLVRYNWILHVSKFVTSCNKSEDKFLHVARKWEHSRCLRRSNLNIIDRLELLWWERCTYECLKRCMRLIFDGGLGRIVRIPKIQIEMLTKQGNRFELGTGSRRNGWQLAIYWLPALKNAH